jgi:hypothetical protein
MFVTFDVVSHQRARAVLRFVELPSKDGMRTIRRDLLTRIIKWTDE